MFLAKANSISLYKYNAIPAGKANAEDQKCEPIPQSIETIININVKTDVTSNALFFT